MKREKILTFIIGFLVGAIIASGAFIVYENVNKVESNNDFQRMMNKDGQMPPMMQNGEMGTPPDLPNMNNDGENSDSSNNKFQKGNKNNGGQNKENLDNSEQNSSDKSNENGSKAPSVPKTSKSE